ncbi:MAG: 2,3-bisphosphoglycerate-independent phosphoglycerate mutase [Candidatus Doudnabacteria bacterium]|nr:2,3-bisphosphoglycerate-independent phosphoglycerate mutase [Candidatus Doudnabacteria bacterium]
MLKFKQLVFLILDGFGVASPSEGNPITPAGVRNINYLINHFPSLTLQASGPSVGLPWGERGNSEVGHLNLGAGRIVSQDLPRISQAIVSGEFFKNPAFAAAIEHVKKNDSKLHLAGLISPGGVHAAEEHLYALLSLASQQNVEKVFVHMFADGRDSAPKIAPQTLNKLTRKFFDFKVGKIATITGRFFSMDRGGHYEVTERTYKAMVLGEGEKTVFPRQAIRQYYEKQIYDETIPPTVVVDEHSRAVASVSEGDAVIFFNFRPDRAVQLVRSFADPSFDKFSRKYPYLQNMHYVTMTQYDKDLPVSVAFPPDEIRNGVSETLSLNNFSQFHIAESEKYAHVTSFFNGGREGPWPGEQREIVTSPASYEKRYEDVPGMSADKIGRAVIEKVRGGTNFVLANFANPDMVGHTGNKLASIAAVEAVDSIVGKVFEAVMQNGACLMITADHGNIEQELDPATGQIDKEHSPNPVPLIAAGRGLERKVIKGKGYFELTTMTPEGVLSDVGPTILDLMGLKKPKEMTAASLMPVLMEQTK